MNATATIAAPTTGPQHMRALERANKVRLARAELKRSVAIGAIDVCEVIMRCPWEADSMAVGDLLMSQRRWGQTRCRKFLAQISMSEKKTIGSMTERQRQSLIALLRNRTPSTGGTDRDAGPERDAQPARSAAACSGAGVHPRARAAVTSS